MYSYKPFIRGQKTFSSLTDNSVGIDLGITTFATAGTLYGTHLHGRKIHPLKPLKKRINKYRKLSKSLFHEN